MSEKKEEKYLAVYTARDGQQIRLTHDHVRRYLVQGRSELVSDQEIMMFVAICKARGLNPFKRDCYLLKYDESPAAIIVSIDYYRSRARAQVDCEGWQCGVIVKDASGAIQYRPGSLVLDNEILLGGWFRAKPRGWTESYEWTVSLSQYIKQRRDGSPTQFWRPESQAYMIAKVAESQGLRRLWPDEFQGLYLRDEIAQESEREIIPEPKPTEDKNEDEKIDAQSGKLLTLEDRLAWIAACNSLDALGDPKSPALADVVKLPLEERTQITIAINQRRKKLREKTDAPLLRS